MNAKQLQDWLESRDAHLQIYAQKGFAYVRVVVSLSQTDWCESPELDEAIRLAMLAFDLLRAPRTAFPCPECGKPVREVRAARTETGWVIESAMGVGSLQACCVAKDLEFTDEKEALWYAATIERWAREEGPR